MSDAAVTALVGGVMASLMAVVLTAPLLIEAPRRAVFERMAVLGGTTAFLWTAILYMLSWLVVLMTHG